MAAQTLPLVLPTNGSLELWFEHNVQSSHYIYRWFWFFGCGRLKIAEIILLIDVEL